MNSQDLAKWNIPDSPGVYFFKKGRDILYVGRATSLRDRTKSYFAADLIATRGPRIVDMVTKSVHLEWQATDSVLEAIILEANLIKKLQPYYNVQEKDDKSWNCVVITKDRFPRVIIVRGRTLEVVKKKKELRVKWDFGPFTSGSTLREALRIIRRMFPYLDEKSLQKYSSAFYRQIGLSPDTAGEEARREYIKNIRHIKLFFDGKKNVVIKSLSREMKDASRKKEFEKAAKIRNKIFALEHIQDVALIKEEDDRDARAVSSLVRPQERAKTTRLETGTRTTPSSSRNFRIEAFDVAHTSGKESVAVMTVVIDGEMAKSEYRKFRLDPSIGNDDTKSTAEVLRRRCNHPEWGTPDMIVIDGGKGQLEAGRKSVQAYFRARSLSPVFGAHKRENTPVLFSDLPTIVSVVKDDRHKARAILGLPSADPKLEKAILLANTEAHRFAITYHRKLRTFGKRNLLK